MCYFWYIWLKCMKTRRPLSEPFWSRLLPGAWMSFILILCFPRMCIHRVNMPCYEINGKPTKISKPITIHRAWTRVVQGKSGSIPGSAAAITVIVVGLGRATEVKDISSEWALEGAGRKNGQNLLRADCRFRHIKPWIFYS